MATITPGSYILLVDDEPNNLFLLEELLRGEGYQTHAVASGLEALAMAENVPPDLIVLDVMMPGINGFEVCRLLRENEHLQTIPIIFLTALDDEESRLMGSMMMADDYLTKPIRSELLLGKVRNILKLNQMRQQKTQAAAQKQVQEAQERNVNLTEKFRLFVPDQFLQRIAPYGVDSIQLGNGHEEQVTILFCDIREFTTIAESQNPQQTFVWLNQFFELMNEAIVRHNGFIDKFLGDAIMAVFDRHPTHPQDAIEAALVMVENLQTLNEQTQNIWDKPVRMGIGIHSGLAVIGTVGSTSRMDSTVIGDVVNTASRLEELTKTYHCNIIVSGHTRNLLENNAAWQWRWLDQIKPRGKQQAIDLYEIQSWTHNPDITSCKSSKK